MAGWNGAIGEASLGPSKVLPLDLGAQDVKCVLVKIVEHLRYVLDIHYTLLKALKCLLFSLYFYFSISEVHSLNLFKFCIRLML